MFCVYVLNPTIDHPAAPKRIDLKRGRGGFIPSFREAMKTREPALVSLSDGLISTTLIEGIEWRGFREPCREAVVCRKLNTFTSFERIGRTSRCQRS